MEKRFEFAEYMKALREKKGLSKRKASILLGYKSDGTINGIEQARMPVPIEKIHGFARLYGVDVSEILEKIKDCEPELYEKYTTLERDITRHFSSRIMGRPELAAHHLPFPGQKGFGSDNVSYANKSGRNIIYYVN